jgi:hypothetical protein
MLWDDDIIGRSVQLENAKALVGKITLEFLGSLDGMPMHKAQAALGPDRGILNQLQIVNVLWNGGGIYFPGFCALYFMPPNMRRSVEQQVHGFLEFLKDLYSEKGPGPYSLRGISEGLGGPDKKPIHDESLVIAAHFARNFTNYFHYFVGAPQSGHPSTLPDLNFMLSASILDYENLERAWKENLRPHFANVLPAPVAVQSARTMNPTNENYEWDLFICHASEDKDGFVKPLALELDSRNLRVWYDEFELRLGDSLREKIDRGLSRSRYGVVVLSKAFFDKDWPQKELDGLNAREINGRKVILPIWHGISREDVLLYSPILADRVAARSSDGMARILEQIAIAIKN